MAVKPPTGLETALARILYEFVDRDFYLLRYPDVAARGEDPMAHFIAHGAAECRDPNPFFDSRWYATHYADVGTAGTHPLLHYLQQGAREGRDPHPRFNAAWYVEQHPEAAANPLLYHLRTGRARGLETEPPLDIADWLPVADLPEAAAHPGPIDIIIPVYRGLEQTRRCLDSVLADADRPDGAVIVIDDASPDPALSAWLDGLAGAGRINLHRNRTNLGFVATVNGGMALAAGRDVVLLNSDTEVPSGWLRRLAAHAARHPRIATISPFSNNATICSWPGGRGGPLPKGFTLEELDRAAHTANPGRAIDLPTTVGFCMFIARAVLDDVGTFDADTFGKGYGEENDFCLRASARGWRHLLACDVFVYHEGAVSFGSAMESRAAKAMEVMTARYPNYLALIGNHVRANAAAPARFALTAALLSQSDRPVILMVSHDLGGCVRRHLDDLTQRFAGRAGVLLLSPSARGVVLSAPELTHHPRLELAAERIDDLLRLLKAAGVSRVHIHHLLTGIRMRVRVLIRRLGVPFDVTIHDYHVICPQANLLRQPDGVYCGEPGPAVCNACIAARPAWGALDIVSWRRRMNWLCLDADRVICPSRDVFDRLARYGLARHAVIAPHTAADYYDKEYLVAPRPPARHGARTDGSDELGHDGGSKHIRRRSRPRIAVVAELLEGWVISPCAFIRLLLPLDHPAIGGDCDVVIADTETILHEQADIIVTQRTASDLAAAQSLTARARAIGAKLVYDIDDDLLNIPRTHPGFAVLQPKAASVRHLLKHADVVWTSTAALATRLGVTRTPPQVLPNGLDERIWNAVPWPPQPTRGPVRILVMGTATHDADYALIEPALVQLKARFGDRVTIDVLGVTSAQLANGISSLRVPDHAALSYPGFVHWFTSRGGWDIGLAPLLDTRFNAAKSAIKTLDYAALGIAVLASDGPVYRGSIADGPGGKLVPNDQTAWFIALSELVLDSTRRRRMGAAAFAAFQHQGTLASLAQTRRRALLSALPPSWSDAVRGFLTLPRAEHVTPQGDHPAEHDRPQAFSNSHFRSMPPPTLPLAELMMKFESLGDNCEFGLVQRAGGAEPIGLLRFADLHIPIEHRLGKLIAALHEGFKGLGAAGSVKLHTAGDNREFIVTEKAFQLSYHTGLHEGQIDADVLLRQEFKRLPFLARKLLDDLESAEKIWVWRSHVTNEQEQLTPLLECLGRYGPNTLLWIVESDPAHPPGTVECLDERLMRGYVEKFAPMDNATDIRPRSWFIVCKKAYDLYRVTAHDRVKEAPQARKPA